MLRNVFFFCLLASSAANAESHLVGSDIKKLLADTSLYGEQNGVAVEQIFQSAGQTFYLVNGDSSSGSWEVRGDQYCSVWPPNPTWSCFDVVEDGPTITFIDKHGKRFPMRKTR